MRNNQDQVDLLKARYDVRRSELEVKRNELLSAIDQKKNLLNLDEANKRLGQLSSDIKSRLEQSEAEIAVLREKRNKAVLNLQREQMRLLQARLLAPMAGLVAIRTNRPTGGMFFRGMQLPDLREGDQIFPGTPVADVLDLSELEVAAKVGEVDRANLYEGQDATIRLDAVPEKVFHGRIKMLSCSPAWARDPSRSGRCSRPPRAIATSPLSTPPRHWRCPTWPVPRPGWPLAAWAAEHVWAVERGWARAGWARAGWAAAPGWQLARTARPTRPAAGAAEAAAASVELRCPPRNARRCGMRCRRL